MAIAVREHEAVHGDTAMPFALAAASETKPRRHKIVVKRIVDEGIIEFEIECPAGESEQCPAAASYQYPHDQFVGECLLEYERGQIGNEIVEGRAEGPGPWMVELSYTGSGEDAEAWITIIEQED